jgi:hypothetical protein
LKQVLSPASDRPSGLQFCKCSASNKSLFASFSSEKEAVFFFKKKNQKTFASAAPSPKNACLR